MIAIEISGGLGNQLFEYSFIYNQHKRLNTSFFMIKTGVPIALYRYFELEKNLFYYIDRILFNYSGFKLLFSHYLRGAFYQAVLKRTINQTLDTDLWQEPADVIKLVADGTLYRGYFQSERFFAEFKHELSSVFKIRPYYQKAFSKKFAWLYANQKIVVIHIRRTDYKTALAYLNLGGDDLCLPIGYYHHIIQEIHHEDNFYVILSDDIDSVKNEFDYLEHKYFSIENEINDFQLMMNADVCIIANSTFSWWAAYLNPKLHKVIYCPKHFLGFLSGIDFPTAIYPHEWKQVDVI
jgi:hypothetical protein